NIIELIKKFIKFLKNLFKKTENFSEIESKENYIQSQKLNINKPLKPKISEDEENFIKKDDAKNISSSQNIAENQEVNEIIDILRKTKIRPLTNQQRNLDREEGGVENEEKETEIHINDEWDNRGKEVEEMANSHPINKSSGKKSMIWNLKRKRLQQKKIEEEIGDVIKDLKKAKVEQSQEGNVFDSRKTQSIKQKIQGLKEDRTDFKTPPRSR
ncbi:MAG: hypothetical protein ACKN9I_05320, partial [Alphaproteobacteria bacterium]